MLFQSITTLAFACLTLPNTAHSWQQEVHNQIGFMAEQLVSADTRAVIQSILAVEPKWNGSLGKAAGWADTVRKTTHRFSYGWHFISARDNPPSDCGLYYHRDCQEGGCVVQQIHNQTQILESCLVKLREEGAQKLKDSAIAIPCAEALKFIAHFVGDVAQPLHTSERSYGGNSVKVQLNGTETNLHAAWDKDILYALAPLPGGPSGVALHPFFADLVSQIQSDSFRSPRSTWTMCDLDSRRGTYCPEQWAKDSNAIVCDYVYGRLVEGSDLLTGDGEYAKGAEHIIEEQIAKAAWRLSGWLNKIVNRVVLENDSVSFRVQRGITQER